MNGIAEMLCELYLSVMGKFAYLCLASSRLLLAAMFTPNLTDLIY